jgi:acyl-CoA reductase-like NAD-dependent aldehyde dehydrogenase
MLEDEQGGSGANSTALSGLSDKIQGSTIEIDDQSKTASTRREPIGVAAQIVPWNYPTLMQIWVRVRSPGVALCGLCH